MREKESKHTIDDANNETFKTVFLFQCKHKMEGTSNKLDKGTFGLIFLVVITSPRFVVVAVVVVVVVGTIFTIDCAMAKKDSHSTLENVLICWTYTQLDKL